VGVTSGRSLWERILQQEKRLMRSHGSEDGRCCTTTDRYQNMSSCNLLELVRPMFTLLCYRSKFDKSWGLEAGTMIVRVV